MIVQIIKCHSGGEVWCLVPIENSSSLLATHVASRLVQELCSPLKSFGVERAIVAHYQQEAARVDIATYDANGRSMQATGSSIRCAARVAFERASMQKRVVVKETTGLWEVEKSDTFCKHIPTYEVVYTSDQAKRVNCSQPSGINDDVGEFMISGTRVFVVRRSAIVEADLMRDTAFRARSVPTDCRFVVVTHYVQNGDHVSYLSCAVGKGLIPANTESCVAIAHAIGTPVNSPEWLPVTSLGGLLGVKRVCGENGSNNVVVAGNVTFVYKAEIEFDGNHIVGESFTGWYFEDEVSAYDKEIRSRAL